LRALADVLIERDRQDDRWGVQNHSEFEWLAILTEEVGEAAQATLEREFGDSEQTVDGLRTEIVQVAAVAIAWVEAFDRANRAS